MLMCPVMAGCSGLSELSSDGESSGAQVTGSGEEYEASTGDGSAYIEYLGSSLDIDGGEFVRDEIEGDMFCLHMTYTNDLSRSTSDNDDFYEKDRLMTAFVLQPCSRYRC